MATRKDYISYSPPTTSKRHSLSQITNISTSAMSEPIPIPQSGKRAAFDLDSAPGSPDISAFDPRHASNASDAPTTPGLSSTPTTPGLLSRQSSYYGVNGFQDADEMESLPPLDRLTVFDFLENLALPQRLEKLQTSLANQREKVRKQQEKLKTSSKVAKERVVEEWRKRVPPDEQFQKYRRRMRQSVERLGSKWGDAKAVTMREKLSFIAGVLNIFISGYLIGAFPEYFHVWYTVQLAYYYPLRFYTYRKRGYHYFLADLCYFVNMLLMLSIWVFPNSKRLFISTFCLAFGNNAVAIAMWRNSLVFHSLDKVVSLFIHIMPCVTLHCLVHLISPELRESRFRAIHVIKTSTPSSPEHYSLFAMALWATIPYATWQLTYHFMITVRRREKIAAGRPTSFTWLRKSYAPTWIGKFVLSLPNPLQEPAFMLIQYFYALLTMVPAPLWFSSRWASAGFLMAVFTWSVYNGANYYIDVFGMRFSKELEQLKKDVAKWQLSPEIGAKTPLMTPGIGDGESSYGNGARQFSFISLGAAAAEAEQSVNGMGGNGAYHNKRSSLDTFTLDERAGDPAGAAALARSTGIEAGVAVDTQGMKARS